jgi:hypothetical protein
MFIRVIAPARAGQHLQDTGSVRHFRQFVRNCALAVGHHLKRKWVARSAPNAITPDPRPGLSRSNHHELFTQQSGAFVRIKLLRVEAVLKCKPGRSRF